MTNGFMRLLKRRHGRSSSPDRTPSKKAAAGGGEAEAQAFFLPGQLPEEGGEGTPQCAGRRQLAPAPLEDEGMHLRWERALAGRPASKLSSEELRELGDRGMPTKHRHALWPQWFAAPGVRDFEQRQRAAPEEAAAQIEADVARTQPGLLGATQQETLRRVLRAYAAGNPEVGYCQGMNNVAAVFVLLGFDEAAALRGCYSLLHGCCPGYHGRELAGFRLDAQVLGELARRVLPASVCQRLEALEVPLEVLASEHFLTLASRSWPLAATARLWDIILQEGSPAVFASFLALLQLYLPSEADLALEAKSASGGEALEPVEVFRQRVLRGVAEDLGAVLREVRALVPRVPQALIDQLRFDLVGKRR